MAYFLRTLIAGAILLLLNACASAPPAVPDTSPETEPTSSETPSQTGTIAEAAETVVEAMQNLDLPPILTPEAEPIIAQPPNPAPLAQKERWHDEREGRALLNRLLPRAIPNRSGWSNDIFNAFSALKIPYTPEFFCASIAVIEQESSWQADPVVPGLNKIVWKEIARRAEKYHVPMFVVEAALLKQSPTGKTYKARIDALKTERQMNALFEDMVSEAPTISRQLGINNPIRTGGPMQVSIDFAKGHADVWPYPYRRSKSYRDEVFTRRGGLYFGIANLLHYPVDYPAMVYRFADFNAGRYSSRNAAFQFALSRLSGDKLDLDGDLLIYEKGRPSARSGSTEQVLVRIAKRLEMSPRQIKKDLLREKEPDFSRTRLYQRVFRLAEEKVGVSLPKQRVPSIRLQSPKIKRKLTTAWFADRVDKRYRQCLSRNPRLAPAFPL